MPPRPHRTPRRTEALTRERIIDTAVELLDTAGESGLTFRALTQRLNTGPGAIYWHVANKTELLDAATDTVITTALTTHPTHTPTTPHDHIHTTALSLYHAIDHHPWLATQLATQLSRNPAQPVTPRIYESIGQQVQALGIPQNTWFTATSALVHYILGAAGQNATNATHARTRTPHTTRTEFLDTTSTAWQQLDPDTYPFTRAIADQLRHHDDQTEFLAGITLILTGITTLHPPTG
ncbi:TetR/AcrR family transcriptional regulator C-terminal domain-containing protein [Actinokineospora sp. PR83]|uniref:TetR/AcrR family transcriptional regulator n=1 Tax=Actinokineospora sp. PR83 TaxID=2884908 RepID=UPI001F256505|nr:TetR/AcrR family transcriptional regulator C-terminal domain-containing protein [Actinokineospora sp. PR83]MCG8920442.1 TetR/AcrR family transcriptional regulator C-terminal domain-containing protein [Actinokineospora sp. PR83]